LSRAPRAAAAPAPAETTRRPPPWWRRARRPRLPSGQIGKIAAYGSTRAVAEGLIGLRGIVLAGMLGPERFGVWALFRLVLTYGTFVGLGMLRGLELEVARARGPGDAAVREAWGRTAAGCTLALFGLISLGAIAAAGVVGEAWLRELLWAVAAGLLLERLWFYGLQYLRAAGSLQRFAVLELVQTVGQVVLTLALAAVWGLGGAFLGFALAHLVALAFLTRRAPFRPALDLGRLRELLAIGVPLSVTQLLTAMLVTVDRLFVGAMLGIAALGQYAFAVSVASLGATAALIVRTVVFPDVYGKVGKEDGGGIARAHLAGTVRPFVLVLSPLAGGAALVLVLLAALALPQYLAAAGPACVFVFTGIAQGAVNLAVLAVVAARRERALPLLTLAALLLNAGLAYASLALGFGMLGLAAGAVVGRLAHAAGVLTLVAAAAGVAAPAATAASILWPLAWCAAVTAAVSVTLPPTDPATFLQAAAAYLIGVTPVLAVALRAVLRLRRG